MEPDLKTVPVKRDFKMHKMGIRTQEMEDLTEEERAAWHRPHYCTDVGALAVFVLGLVAMGWVLNYGRTHGDLRRLYHGLNFHGELCGVDPMVEHAPFIFWCSKPWGDIPTSLSEVLNPSDTVDLAHPICVQECPASEETHHQCYQSKLVTKVSRDAITGTFTENVTYNYRLVRDYETRPVAAHWCVPANITMMKQLRGKMEVGWQAAMLDAGQVLSSWAALICSALLAVLLGYIYLYLVGRLVDEIIYAFIGIAVLLPLIAGSAVLIGALCHDESEEFMEHYGWSNAWSRMPSTGDKRLDVAAGIVCLAVGALVAIAACCLRHSLKLIIGAIEAATEALRAMPTLLLAPLISVIFKVVMFMLELAGFALMMSCGRVERVAVFEEFVPGGLARKFSLEDNEMGYLAVYCFMALWILELAFAMEQFVLAYSVQLWFFKEYDNNRRKGFVVLPMVRGFLTAVKYHLGTLALGSLLLSLLEAIHFILATLHRRMQDREGDDNRRCDVAKILAGCCCCCMSCFECFIRFINKNAYIVTAVESKPFCNAAQLAFSVVANEIAAIGMLSLALKFFMAVGFVSITSLGAYLTWLLVHTVDAFKDPSSPHFVSKPEAVTGTAALISALVAATFMLMFDMVADTILFCWALDRKYRNEHGMPAGNNVPLKLRELMESESNESLLGS